jgi:putative addiction module component (TIGR02574 family)
MKKSLEKILKLSVEERMLLVEDIWDSISTDVEKETIPESHKAELDRRLKAEKNGTAKYSKWADVKKRIHAKL